MKLNVAPGARSPEFHDAGSPLSLVVVCVAEPVFVHWTVLPTVMVTLFGEKAKSTIVIFTV